MANQKISQLSNAAALTGTEQVPIVQSGSTVKATTQNIGNLALPSQTGQNGKYLQTNGTTASWATVSGGSPTIVIAAIFSGGVITHRQVFNNTGSVVSLTYLSAPAGFIALSSNTGQYNGNTIVIAPNIFNQNLNTMAFIGQSYTSDPSTWVMSYRTNTGSNYNFTTVDTTTEYFWQIILYP